MAETALSAPPAREPRDLLLSALATRSEGYAPAVSALSNAVHACGELSDNRWFWMACRLAQDPWATSAGARWRRAASRVARETGALSTLPVAANYLAALHVHGTFEWATAGSTTRAAAMTRRSRPRNGRASTRT